MTEDNELTRRVELVNPLGLHARPAAIIAKIAAKAQQEIRIHSNGRTADAGSIIDILAMSGTRGKVFILEAGCPEDLPLLAEIARAFEAGFGEETAGEDTAGEDTVGEDSDG